MSLLEKRCASRYVEGMDTDAVGGGSDKCNGQGPPGASRTIRKHPEILQNDLDTFPGCSFCIFAVARGMISMLTGDLFHPLRTFCVAQHSSGDHIDFWTQVRTTLRQGPADVTAPAMKQLQSRYSVAIELLRAAVVPGYLGIRVMNTYGPRCTRESCEEDRILCSVFEKYHVT